MACIDIRNGVLERNEGLKLCEQYDGRRPASLDLFLKVIGITEQEFEEILLSQAVIDWGFHHESILRGEVLPDMGQWDEIV